MLSDSQVLLSAMGVVVVMYTEPSWNMHSLEDMPLSYIALNSTEVPANLKLPSVYKLLRSTELAESWQMVYSSLYERHIYKRFYKTEAKQLLTYD